MVAAAVPYADILGDGGTRVNTDATASHARRRPWNVMAPIVARSADRYVMT